MSAPGSAPSVGADEQTMTKSQIRGSSLLLVGRIVSLGLNLVVQVLIVRYLSKTSFGAFAYGLSIASLAESFVTFGLDRAVTRFLPIYDEQRDHARVLGVLVLVVGTILSLGLSVVLLFYGAQSFVGDVLIDDPQAIALLLVLIFLAPVQALNNLFTHLFSVLGSARAIFFRRYVLAPGLRIAIVLMLISTGSSVRFLAVGYVLAGVVGIAAYATMFVRVVRDHPVVQGGFRGIRIPAREVLLFTVPLFSTDLLFVAMNSVDAVMLGAFAGAEQVAALRAVQPVARLNQLALTSFGILFTPVASRLFARSDLPGLNRMYWQSAVWVAVLSFPVFAATFGLARPLTLLLFGDRYEDSAILLAILAFGYYVNSSTGFNGMTLNVFNKVRYVVGMNIAALGFNVGVNLLLIPRFGALGAAIGTATTLVVHNVLKQAGLLLGTGVRLFDREFGSVYAVVAGAATLLLVAELAFSPPIVVTALLVVSTSTALLVVARRALHLEDTFPEVMRIPLLRLLLRRPGQDQDR